MNHKQTIMNKVLGIITISILFALSLTSCVNENAIKKALEEVINDAVEDAVEDGFDGTKGFRPSPKWGKVSVKDFGNFTPFTAIKAEGKVDINFFQTNEINKNEEYSVSFFGNEKVFDHYDVKVSDDGVLLITAKQRLDSREPKISVNIKAPDLTHITMSGTGDFTLGGETPAELSELTIMMSGTGDVEFLNSLNCTGDLSISNSGTGDVKISKMTCHDAVFDNTGTGDIDVAVKAVNIKATSSGTGDIDLEVDCDKIIALANGTSEIEIEGTARTFVRESSGLGKIDSKKLSAGKIIRTE